MKFFYKLDEIGNNADIGISVFTTWKQKKSSNKILPQWALNPWTSDSKSNALFSELIWHVTPVSINSWTSDSKSNTLFSEPTEVQGFNTQHFVTWINCFQVVKPLMPTSGVSKNL